MRDIQYFFFHEKVSEVYDLDNIYHPVTRLYNAMKNSTAYEITPYMKMGDFLVRVATWVESQNTRTVIVK
jgi:hypothetical protein